MHEVPFHKFVFIFNVEYQITLFSMNPAQNPGSSLLYLILFYVLFNKYKASH